MPRKITDSQLDAMKVLMDRRNVIRDLVNDEIIPWENGLQDIEEVEKEIKALANSIYPLIKTM